MRPWMLVLLAACNPTTPDPTPDPLELRTFTVPAGYADRLTDALNRAFDRGDADVARATLAPGGAVVVVAPASVLGGVEALVAQLSATPLDEPRNIRLDYWLVRGVADPSLTEARFGEGLGPVTPVLEAIAKEDGPLFFTLDATRRLVSLDGEFARTKDDAVQIDQVVSIAPGGLIAELTVDVPGGAETRTRLALQPGQTSVLAQSGVRGRAGGRLDPGPPAELYLLVRASVP